MTSSSNGPPDGGWGWVCVVGKLWCYFIVVGTSSAFGIIYIDFIDYFNTTRETAAWIGSLTFGLTLLAGPLSSALTSRFGVRKATVVGTLLAFSGCGISFFANGIPFLYVSYGVMMGIGLGIVLVPCVLIVAQYFDRRLGLANAIGSCGNGLGALVLPPLYTYLIGEYGWRGTLLILSGLILNGLVCAVLFIQPEYLKSSRKIPTSKTNRWIACLNYRTFLCKSWLMVYILGTAFAFLGYIVPFVHLPDMAVQKGIDKYQAAYLISIMGVANIIGRIVFGWINDLHCTNAVILQGLALMVCGVVTAVCPHLTDFYAFAVYSAIYGAFIGVFLSLLPVAIIFLVGLERTGDVLGIILFLAGIMDTVASPIAGWIFDLTRTYNVSFYVAACPLFLAGLMDIIVMQLHRRHIGQNIEEDVASQEENSQIEKVVSVLTVQEPCMIRENTLEQTYM